MKLKIRHIFDEWMKQNHDILRQRLLDTITFSEDAFQDTYLAISTQPLQDFDGNIEKLFFAIYRKKLKQEYYRGYRMVHPQQTFFDLLVDVEVAPEHTPCLAQIQKYIHRNLTDERDKVIFNLWVLQRKSRSYIAEYMGIAQSTVSAHKKNIKNIIYKHYIA